MAIYFENREIDVVDRSIVYIQKNIKDIKKEELIYYCYSLLGIGVDHLEVEKDFFDVMKNDYDFFSLIIRLNKLSELYEFPGKIYSIVLKWRDFLLWAAEISFLHINRDTILEMRFSEIRGFFEEWKLISESNRQSIKKIRICDFDRRDLAERKDDLNEIRKFLLPLKIGIEISPGNLNKTGTATFLESIDIGVDSIVCSFAGAEPFYPDLALEEMLLAHTLLNTEKYNVDKFQRLQLTKNIY